MANDLILMSTKVRHVFLGAFNPQEDVCAHIRNGLEKVKSDKD